MYIYIYVYIYIYTSIYISYNVVCTCAIGSGRLIYDAASKDAMVLRCCFFFFVIPLYSVIAGCQVHKPRCLSPAAHSLYSKIAGCQVLSLDAQLPIACIPGLLVARCLSLGA